VFAQNIFQYAEFKNAGAPSRFPRNNKISFDLFKLYECFKGSLIEFVGISSVVKILDRS
jgi:hypothetical protein